MINIRALCGLLLCLSLLGMPVYGKTLQCAQTLKPVSGWYLGVQEGRVLRFYSTYDGKWERTDPSEDFHVPINAEGLHFNQSKIGVVRGTRVDFYEGPDGGSMPWREAGSMPLPKLESGEVIVEGLWSTQNELLAVGQSRAASFDQGGEYVLARYSHVLPAQIDCMFDVLHHKLAVVSGRQVSFYEVSPGATGSKADLRLLPAMAYTLPPDVDEVVMFQFRYLGIRLGQQLHFLQYDTVTKAWTTARDIPDLKLDALPVR